LLQAIDLISDEKKPGKTRFLLTLKIPNNSGIASAINAVKDY